MTGESPAPRASESVHSQHALRDVLELQRAQLEALRNDGQQRLNELASAFQVMTGAVAHSPKRDDASVRESLASAVTTLQFADNQAQRLEHLIRALDQIKALVSTPGTDDDSHWQALRAGLRASYTMERETEVFDQLFGPPDVSITPPPADGGADAIELF